jgi:hypothetical protein
MQVKLVARILDVDNRLLAWAPVLAETRGDRCLWATQAAQAPVERAGTPVTLSVHWPDMNVQTRVPMPSEAVEPGRLIALSWDQPIFRFGSDDGPLPGVTVRAPVVVSPDVGNISAIGHR